MDEITFLASQWKRRECDSIISEWLWTWRLQETHVTSLEIFRDNWPKNMRLWDFTKPKSTDPW